MTKEQSGGPSAVDKFFHSKRFVDYIVPRAGSARKNHEISDLIAKCYDGIAYRYLIQQTPELHIASPVETFWLIKDKVIASGQNPLIHRPTMHYPDALSLTEFKATYEDEYPKEAFFFIHGFYNENQAGSLAKQNFTDYLELIYSLPNYLGGTKLAFVCPEDSTVVQTLKDQGGFLNDLESKDHFSRTIKLPFKTKDLRQTIENKLGLQQTNY